jgi:hypothetical protein
MAFDGQPLARRALVDLPLPILTFAVMTAYLPYTVSAASAGRWAVLTAGVPLLLLTRIPVPSPQLKRVGWLGAALLLYICLSFLWTYEPLDTFYRLVQLLVIAGAFILGSCQQNIRMVALAFIAGAGVSLPFAIAQYFGYQPVETVSFQGGEWLPVGLFLTKNALGEVAAIALVLSIAFRFYYLAFIPVTLLALSHSREAFFMLAVSSVAYLWQYKLWRSLALVLCGSVIAFVTYAQPTTVIGRLDIILHTLSNVTLLGWGLGTYGTLFPGYEFAHNEFVQLIFELGLGSLFVFGIIGYGIAAIPQDRTSGSVLAAVLASALVWAPFANPATAFIFAVVLGHLCALRYPVFVGQYQSRADSLSRLPSAADSRGSLPQAG